MRISLLPVFLISIFTAACDYQSIEEGGASTSCENNSRCQFNNNVEVWLSNSKVSPETPFTINLKLPDDAKNPSAKLEGVSMYMGFIPVQFTNTEQIWTANTMVGACSEPVMTWKMIVTYQDASNKTHTLFYYFDSIQP